MTRLSKYRVLICGILSPLAALFLYVLVYGTLTRYSADLEKDWLFRLSVSTLAMTVPFFVTLALAIKDHGRHALSLAGKVGLVIAFLSLGLAWKPVSDGILRSRQSRNLALRDVAAPPFDTPDLQGNNSAPGRSERQGRAGQYLGDLVRSLPAGDAEARPLIPGASGSRVHRVRAFGREHRSTAKVRGTGPGDLPASHRSAEQSPTCIGTSRVTRQFS